MLSCLSAQIMSALLCPFAILLIKFSETDLTSHDDQVVAHQQQPTEMVTYLPARANLSNQVVPESQSECSEPTKFTTFNRHTLKKKMRHKLYHVKFSSSRQQGDGIGVFTAIHFYHTAPVVKFCYHTVSIYLFFFFIFFRHLHLFLHLHKHVFHIYVESMFRASCLLWPVL